MAVIFVTDRVGRSWPLDSFKMFTRKGEAVMGELRDGDYPVEFRLLEWTTAVEAAAVQVVAAAPGHFAVEAFWDHEEEKWEAHLAGVVAWQMQRGYARPITFEMEVAEDLPVMFPDGHIEKNYGGMHYPSLEAYLESRPSEAQMS